MALDNTAKITSGFNPIGIIDALESKGKKAIGTGENLMRFLQALNVFEMVGGERSDSGYSVSYRHLYSPTEGVVAFISAWIHVGESGVVETSTLVYPSNIPHNEKPLKYEQRFDISGCDANKAVARIVTCLQGEKTYFLEASQSGILNMKDALRVGQP